MMNEQIIEILTPVLYALLSAGAALAIYFVKVAASWLKAKMNSELAAKYTDMIEKTIIDCVTKTNQCYVDALKEKGEFTQEAQELAFKNTKEEIIRILTGDALDYLKEITGDVDAYLTSKIESTVKTLK